MTLSKKHKTLFYVLFFLCFFGFINFIQHRIGYYSIEPMIDKGLPSTSHSVDLPINTTYSCNNMCGPMAKCSITGEQCSTDVDCYGCRPTYVPPKTNYVGDDVRGQNDAGKLTVGQTPQYSSLTTDIGSRAAFFDKNAQVPQYSEGTNIWRTSFDYGLMLYDKRYNPNLQYQEFLPKYPERTTLSGEFVDNGPLAANDYLNV
jgi:hypothetical protein